ncbi:hypothetical protein PCYB_004670 [Plasmodium cynomolgi strain B]|uniref:CYIR protein n=1 Tax=Plasmodium cynomolgi (strain B) TaxID=1120755 RepID=K6UNQ9_PLACD|nr:hypothetical protein PCYB_004670 [Plasmodium cynomolgi strain B]GAB69718.1 hypothetical protein PCYB_004670 [Plasmodium cynomolgi strain B]
MGKELVNMLATCYVIKSVKNILKEMKAHLLCSKNFNHVKHLDDDEFLKMRDLYDFYDNYIQLSPKNAHTDKNYCNNMIYLVHLYHTFLNKNPSGSLEFNDVLRHIQVLIDSITNTGRNHCEGKTFFIREPELFKPIVVQIQHLHNKLSGPDSKPSQEGVLDNVHTPKHSQENKKENIQKIPKNLKYQQLLCQKIALKEDNKIKTKNTQNNMKLLEDNNLMDKEDILKRTKNFHQVKIP